MLYRYSVDQGVTIEVEVRPAVAQVLDELEQPLKERLLRRPDHWGSLPVPVRASNDFTLLVGLSLTWPAAPRPDGSCPACGGRWLGPHAYCLVCDRCGRDGWMVGTVGPSPAPSRPFLCTDGLAGGIGKPYPQHRTKVRTENQRKPPRAHSPAGAVCGLRQSQSDSRM
jgi:hypothetical protein